MPVYSPFMVRLIRTLFCHKHYRQYSTGVNYAISCCTFLCWRGGGTGCKVFAGERQAGGADDLDGPRGQRVCPDEQSQVRGEKEDAFFGGAANGERPGPVVLSVGFDFDFEFDGSLYPVVHKELLL